MQFIREVCLLELITSSLTVRHNYTAKFNWASIVKYQQRCVTSYNFDDAQILLQLSFLISREIPLQVPNKFEHTALPYDKCPQTLVAAVIPKSPMNLSANLGHILYDRAINVLYIVFTGTVNGCMVAMDLDYRQTTLAKFPNSTPDIKAHRGFYHGYMSIRDLLVAAVKRYLPYKPQIVITGHSLGGALSQLCAYDLAYYNPIHYSFGSPMVFNSVGAMAFDKFVKHSYRIANLSDLVVVAPLPVMPNGDAFYHVGNLIYFQDNLGDFSLNHTFSYMTQYALDYEVFEKADGKCNNS
jgi:hypothetical protein